MKTRILVSAAVMLLAFAANSYAQDGPNSGPVPETSACAFNFVTGGGPSALNWCVSTHANLVRFESPAGFEHLFAGTPWEGYVLCSGTTVLAYDIGSAEVGWGASFVIAGPTATSVTIRRLTSNGLWQLDQQFKRDNKELDVTINMTLTNLGGPVADVRLARVNDIDTDNDFGDDVMDRTDRSVTGREARGLSLTNITWNLGTDTAITAAAAACSPASVATPAVIDNWGNVTARLGNMGPGNKKKVTFVYRRY
jgi:hypothetical protein